MRQDKGKKLVLLIIVLLGLFSILIFVLKGSNSNDNLTLFLNEQGVVTKTLHETNAELMLESLLEKSLEDKKLVFSEKITENFCKNNLCGFWPLEQMTNGRKYFFSKELLRLRYDVDVTSWAYKLSGKVFDDNTIKKFISDSPLPKNFLEICLAISCDRKYIIRVWDDQGWNNEIDIISTANTLSSLNTHTLLQRQIFKENRALINYILRKKNIANYYLYYSPKVTGIFLLLFYDDSKKFLSTDARAILLNLLNKRANIFKTMPLFSRWGGDINPIWVYGLNIIYCDSRTPSLMNLYAEKHLYFNTNNENKDLQRINCADIKNFNKSNFYSEL